MKKAILVAVFFIFFVSVGVRAEGKVDLANSFALNFDEIGVEVLKLEADRQGEEIIFTAEILSPAKIKGVENTKNAVVKLTDIDQKIYTLQFSLPAKKVKSGKFTIRIGTSNYSAMARASNNMNQASNKQGVWNGGQLTLIEIKSQELSELAK